MKLSLALCFFLRLNGADESFLSLVSEATRVKAAGPDRLPGFEV